MVREQGFAFQPIEASAMPRGFLARHAENSVAALLGSRRRKLADAEIRLHRAVVEGRARSWFRRSPPDVLLVDSILWSVPFCAASARIPTVLVTTDQSAPSDAIAPPVSVYMQPAADASDRAAVGAVWHRLVDRLQRAAGETVAKLTARYATAGGGLSWTEWGPRAQLPEICLGPEALDLPRASAVHGRVYAGPGIDPRRIERAAAPRVRTSRPMIYVSIGSNSHSILGPAAQLLQAVMATMRGRPGIRAIVQHGPWIDPDLFVPVPDNVQLVAWAPQPRLIRKAAAVVTHGGFGAVKECAAAGTPMVVFPVTLDTPGNASRVLHHGLGRIVLPHALTAERLGDAIDEAIEDTRVRERAAAMAAALAADRGLAEARRLVEAQAGARTR